MRQPSFIQYAYLDLKDDEAVNHFYEALKEEVEANHNIKILPYSVVVKVRNPRLQNEIIEILNAWHTNTVRKAGIDERLQNHSPIRVFRADEGDEFGTEEVYYVEIVNVDTRGLLFEQIMQAMLEGKKIRKCAAEDCDKYFVPVGLNAWRMKYCSERCRLREAQRRYRQRKKR